MADEARSSEMPFGVAVILTLVGIGLSLASLMGWIGPALWCRFAYRPAVATVLETRPTEEPIRGGTRYGLEARLGFSVGGREYRPWVACPGGPAFARGPRPRPCGASSPWASGSPASTTHSARRWWCWNGPRSNGVCSSAWCSPWPSWRPAPAAWPCRGPGRSPRQRRAVRGRPSAPRRFYLHLLDATAIGLAGAVWLAAAPRGLGVLGLLGAIAVALVMFHRAARAGAVASPEPAARAERRGTRRPARSRHGPSRCPGRRRRSSSPAVASGSPSGSAPRAASSARHGRRRRVLRRHGRGHGRDRAPRTGRGRADRAPGVDGPEARSRRWWSPPPRPRSRPGCGPRDASGDWRSISSAPAAGRRPLRGRPVPSSPELLHG